MPAKTTAEAAAKAEGSTVVPAGPEPLPWAVTPRASADASDSQDEGAAIDDEEEVGAGINTAECDGETSPRRLLLLLLLLDLLIARLVTLV